MICAYMYESGFEKRKQPLRQNKTCRQQRSALLVAYCVRVVSKNIKLTLWHSCKCICVCKLSASFRGQHSAVSVNCMLLLFFFLMSVSTISYTYMLANEKYITSSKIIQLLYQCSLARILSLDALIGDEFNFQQSKPINRDEQHTHIHQHHPTNCNPVPSQPSKPCESASPHISGILQSNTATTKEIITIKASSAHVLCAIEKYYEVNLTVSTHCSAAVNVYSLNVCFQVKTNVIGLFSI